MSGNETSQLPTVLEAILNLSILGLSINTEMANAADDFFYYYFLIVVWSFEFRHWYFLKIIFFPFIK